VLSLIYISSLGQQGKGFANKDLAIMDDWKRFKLRIGDKDIQFSLVIYGAFLYLGFGNL